MVYNAAMELLGYAMDPGKDQIRALDDIKFYIVAC